MAEIGTLNSFYPNTTIQSSQVNANFDDIKAAFNSYAVLTDVAKLITATHNWDAAQDFAAGTVALPGIYFNGDTDTGLFQPAPDVVGISVNATEIFRVDAAGVDIVGVVAATSFAGDGSALTALNASALGSGTVPSAVVAGSYSGITGVGTLVGLTVTGAINTDSLAATGALTGASLDVSGEVEGGSFALDAVTIVTAGAVLQNVTADPVAVLKENLGTVGQVLKVAAGATALEFADIEMENPPAVRVFTGGVSVGSASDTLIPLSSTDFDPEGYADLLFDRITLAEAGYYQVNVKLPGWDNQTSRGSIQRVEIQESFGGTLTSIDVGSADVAEILLSDIIAVSSNTSIEVHVYHNSGETFALGTGGWISIARVR